MTKAIVHIGAGKCGSSALQYSLTQSDDLYINGGRAKYFAVNRLGMPLFGKELRKYFKYSPYGYASMPNVGFFENLNSVQFGLMRRSIEHEVKGGVAITSCEGWILQSDIFSKSRFLEKMGLECDVVMYVRPPVDWLNSAWWQWGAWTGADFDRWLTVSQPSVRWASLASRWKQVPGVKNVEIRLLKGDIVEDFSNRFNIEGLASCKHNSSLDSSILRLFQEHPELRPGAHESEIDFVVSKYINVGTEPTPWVIPMHWVEKIMEGSIQDSLRLRELCDPKTSELISNDSRWWKSSAYEDKKVSDPGFDPKYLSRDSISQVAKQAIKALLDLDRENRELKRKFLK